MKQPNTWFKHNLPHILAIAFFIAISFIYCSPLLQGKVPSQSDVVQAKGMQKEVNKYRTKDGHTPLWTNVMFGGMPTYEIGGNLYTSNIGGLVIRFFTTLFPNPVFLIMIYLLGAYLLFSVLNFDPWLAVAASVAITFSTYNFVLIDAGHNNQALAIAFFTPVVAGILLTYRKSYYWGAFLTAFFLSVELRSGHPQMTYYLGLMMAILVLAKLIDAIVKKTLKAYFTASAYLGLALFVALLTNITSIWVNKEFVQETNRGKTELTLNKAEPRNGLSKDYAYTWSQGIGECMTFLVPNAYGGASDGYQLGPDSETAKALAANNAPLDYLSGIPTYWGGKPGTSGPTYFGVGILFLFLLGLLIVRGPLKWWLLAVTIFSILLSLGKNFQEFSDLFFDHFPLYNKFRSVESILVIAGLAIPMLAFFTIRQIAERPKGDENSLKNLKISFYVLGGILLLLIIFRSAFFTFAGATDANFPVWLKAAIITDRSTLFWKDALKSLIFMSLTAGTVWLLIERKIKITHVYILIGVITLVDLWWVDKRFMNDSKFVSKAEQRDNFQPRPVDEEIMKDSTLDYRVFDQTIDPFNNATGSNWYNTVGGYNAAKLKRYQELIENQLSKGNIHVFNMLNTKYFIVADSAKRPVVQLNRAALGNAWFVSSVQFVATADEEMNSLTGFDPKEEAIIDHRYQPMINLLKMNFDPNATIKLVSYDPEHMVYDYNSATAELAIFSEIYYDKGWKALIDGKPAPYFRADYVLRGMQLPAGIHKIEFIFHPDSYYTGEKISLAGSTLLVLGFLGLIWFEFRKRGDKPELSEDEFYEPLTPADRIQPVTTPIKPTPAPRATVPPKTSGAVHQKPGKGKR